MATLTATAFELLLARLNADPSKAAELYEELRLKLTKRFVWKGCLESQADALSDETLDRVAAKLAQGIEVKSLNAYACEVSRFVWLEYQRKNKEEGVGDNLPDVAAPVEFFDEPNERYTCLKKCLPEVASDEADRQLIIGYYDVPAGEKNKDWRKDLAERLGLTMNTLKVKACRLRDRLEKCINECVRV